MRAVRRVLSIYWVLLMIITGIMVLLRQNPSSATWLAYASDKDGNWNIYRQLGNQTEQLTHSPSLELAPFWSPDGSTILYLSDRDERVEIYQQHLDTRIEEAVTVNMPLTANSPTMSPDAGWILLSAYLPNEDQYDIFKISASGRDFTPLINTVDDEQGAALSPDGGSIVYFGNPLGEPAKLYVWSLVDQSKREIPLDGILLESSYPPAWSPEGKRVVLTGRRSEDDFEIYRVNIETGATRRLTDNDVDDFAPAWSPDGRWIAYSTWQDGNLNIYRMRSDGSDVVAMTDDAAFDVGSAWSPLIDLGWDFEGMLIVIWVIGTGLIVMSRYIYQREYWVWDRRLKRKILSETGDL